MNRGLDVREGCGADLDMSPLWDTTGHLAPGLDC